MRTPPLDKVMNAQEWSLLIALSVVWGGSFFFNGVAVKELPTFTVVVCRVALAAVLLFAVMRIVGETMPRDARAWRAFFGMGVLNNVMPFSLIVWGQSHISSGLASILNATTPLFTVLLASWLTADERLTSGRLLGVLIGLAGVGVLMGGDTLRQPDGDVLAQVACLAGALSYALAGIFGRRFRRMGISPLATATGQVTASSLILIPAMLLIDQPWNLPAPSLPAIGALIGVASLSTALAYILYFQLLATAGVTNLLLVTLLIPVSAILLGTFVLGELLEPKHFVGIALIGFGLAAIDGRPWRIATRAWTRA